MQNFYLLFRSLVGLAVGLSIIGQPHSQPYDQEKLTAAASLALHFGGPGSDGANKIVRLADDGYALGGWKAKDGSSDITESWLVRVDARGTYMWDIPLPGSQPYGITALSPTLDGGLFTIDGELSSQRGKTRLSKLSPDGAIELQYEYGHSTADEITALRPTFDGGLIMAGRTYQRASMSSDGWVVKLDRNLATQWFRMLSGVTSNRDDALEDIIIQEDGTYLAVGWTTGEDDNTRGWAIKISPGGATILSETYDFGPGTEIHSAQPAPANSVVIAASSQTDSDLGRRAVLAGLTERGSVSWRQGLSSGATAFATGLARTDRSNFLASASIEDDNGQAGLIVALTHEGRLTSIQRHSGDGDHRVLAVAAASGSGYAAAGSSQRSRGLDQDMWLLINQGDRSVGPTRPSAAP